MTNTELHLLALHRTPAVPLDDICDTYLSMAADSARRHAALNTLPFPTFRLSSSIKAPIMVKLSDLAKLIDRQHQCAQAAWETSQV